MSPVPTVPVDSQLQSTTLAPPGSIVAAVSREIVRLYAHLLGRGPTRARTHLLDDHLICVLEDVFSRSERTLIEAGRGERVVGMRNALHSELASTLSRIVEEETGRGVVACLGQVDVEADLVIEFFRLEPGPATAQPSRSTRPSRSRAASIATSRS